ncbi:ABC transporter permease [Helicobacter cappadocius]|uniref:ABC transporter permease n=1 Tax=Helicobacter cappadocius TaxID=3063998 RepID=A0AA90PJI7_9HELI|nr:MULTISPECIES: ABC transporter permease [unclassified Helicobacter]MDO7252984.1 ABC transporter permease [Helicobacter sp. faydin-H75]MDP2539026.1 ABC transporter permease [Helicobacter sp. faydin-H76]
MSFTRVVFEEFRAIFTNIPVIFVVIVGSFLYAFLYPAPYKNNIVQSQKIVVVDNDNTTLSKKLIFLVQASAEVDVDKVTSSMKKAQELLNQGKVYGILQIPNGFEASVYRHIPVEVFYLANASYFLIYGAVIDGIHRAVEEFSANIKLRRLLFEGKSQNEDIDLIVRDSIPLYNPTVGYINYALAAILVFILHQTLIAGAGILGATQNEQNLKGIKGYWNEIGGLKLVLARMFAFFCIYVVLFLLYFGFLFQLYGVNIGADIVSFWCFSAIFILCCASFGTLLGLLINHPALPTQIVLISSLPLIFMMGFIWPLELLPKPIVWAIHFIPAFEGVNGFIRINQMGADLHLVMNDFFWLLGLCIGCVMICVLVIRQKMGNVNDSEKR